MTQYGRGQGSEPWHPEDPLYGDGGWEGQQAQQPSYDGRPQHHPQQPQYGDWGHGPQGAYDQTQQSYPQQYEQQHAQYSGQGQQEYQGGWNTGTQGQPQVPYPADPLDPYGNQAGAHGADQADFYGTPDAYPPPEPPARRRDEPGDRPEETGWDPGPDQGEQAFFAGEDAEDEADGGPDERAAHGDRRGRGGKGAKGKGGKKSRNGFACLVVVLVLGGGVGGVGYFGYQFYQDRFGAAPDYIGEGTQRTVTVTIAGGASGYTIGQELKKADVVKSVDAFVTAQANNPDGDKIQAGVYVLNTQMSAANAVALMLDPKSRNNLVIAEGKRNAAIYELIDERLEVDEGTTAEVAKTEWKNLGLPGWAMNHEGVRDPLEGFLYPSSYPVAKGQKPEDVLREMVAQANEQYEKIGLEEQAKGLGLEGPWQLLTVASLVQAEGKTHDDFRKMAEVVYNRLKPTNTETNQKLQFDSTFNYLKGQSNIHVSESEINSNTDAYNTYYHRGLPPGPIGNPGEEALSAALDPTDDGWIYFVATDGVSKTEFARTHDEFLELKDKFNASAGN
ncbi:membrane protein [Streptomyces ruber]|uniref:Endolytic murein transglycosylase n=2 Tax=Streptomyces TaxID=1883 RepID=A0A918BCC9_9ACTN|nr:endolytic transglycosylase MltG [Streptomyces ruber]GGQ59064.1 membrane protein [Streptomyces ruber]